MAGFLALAAAVRRARAGEVPAGPVVVAGARELVPLLVKELRAGGDPSAVREGGPATGASVFVWLGKADEDALRAASRARVPIVGVTDGESLPYVLDTNLVEVRPGEGLPVERIERAIANAGQAGWSGLARRLPALREPLVDSAVRKQAVVNAVVSARSESIELPALVLTHYRLLNSIGRAYGARIPPLPGIAAGAGLFALSRQVDQRARRFRWLLRGLVAYSGTRAVGEAARRWGSVRPGS